MSLGKNIFINNGYRNCEIRMQMEEIMKKIVFTLALVAAMCVCSTAPISAAEEERFHFRFRTVNFPGDTFTQLLGINDLDRIAAYHGAAVNQGLDLNLPSNINSENCPRSPPQQ